MTTVVNDSVGLSIRHFIDAWRSHTAFIEKKFLSGH
jgi:hypothetical protein